MSREHEIAWAAAFHVEMATEQEETMEGAIKAGDAVEWPHPTESLSTRRGIVLAFDGDTALVQTAGEEPDEVPALSLTLWAAVEEEDWEPWHVYAREEDGPRHIATTNEEGLATTLKLLREEGQIDDDMRIGVLHRPFPSRPGTWIINPYAKGAA